MTERVGPIESREWPAQLDANAVTTGWSPRMMGYDVEADLAGRYRFSDLIFLSVTGELPDDDVSRGFEIALSFLLPMSVAEAPIHASALARVCGARPSGVLSVASLALGEHASELYRRFGPVLRSLPGELPGELRASSPEEAASVARLAALVPAAVDVPVLALGPSRELALVGLLWACGLREESKVVSVLVMARIPSGVAEAQGRAPLRFADYPTTTPPFRFEP